MMVITTRNTMELAHIKAITGQQPTFAHTAASVFMGSECLMLRTVRVATNGGKADFGCGLHRGLLCGQGNFRWMEPTERFWCVACGSVGRM